MSARSSPNSVAAAMAALLRHGRPFVVSVVGAGALNQAVKAIAIARSQASANGLDVVAIPSFALVDIEGVERTALLLRVEHRPPPAIDLRDPAPARDPELAQGSDVPLSP